MKIVGIDLSGPSNIQETSLVYFADNGDRLSFLDNLSGVDDRQIFDLVSLLAAEDGLVVGLDAPLSYNIGGGDRVADSDLRQTIVKAGLRSGSVMPPTMTRMVYLTLRGIAIARSLESLSGDHSVQLVEVHPGAAMALRGAPVEAVRTFKHDAAAREQLLTWLAGQNLENLTALIDYTDHDVAACAAAFAAWKWRRGESYWIEPATPPHHPYDFAC